jgi:hypothetical protein
MAMQVHTGPGVVGAAWIPRSSGSLQRSGKPAD